MTSIIALIEPASDETIARMESAVERFGTLNENAVAQLVARIHADATELTTLLQRCEKAEARVTELELIRDSHSRDTLAALRERDGAMKALEPFAALTVPPFPVGNVGHYVLSFADLRAARNAMGELPNGQE